VIDRLRRHQPQRLAHGRRAHLPVLGDPPVQLAQKGPAVVVVILPRIFTVEDNGHQRVASGTGQPRAVFADAPQKILGRWAASILA